MRRWKRAPRVFPRPRVVLTSPRIACILAAHRHGDATIAPLVQLTVHEAAKCLRVPENTIHRWIRDRGLPAVKFNEQYRLNPVDLLVWA
jgi:excisionase family DNA binding protein